MIEQGNAPAPPTACVAVQVLLFTVTSDDLLVLLAVDGREIEARQDFPSAFMYPTDDKDLDAAARRVLREKVGIGLNVRISHALTASTHDDSWILLVSYSGLTEPDHLNTVCMQSSGRLKLARIASVPDEETGDLLAEAMDLEGGSVDASLDAHSRKSLAVSVDLMRRNVTYSDLALDALPATFTLKRLQEVHEAILGRELNKDSFRRSVTQSRGLIEATQMRETDVGHRPAQLYRRSLDSSRST